MKRIHVTFNGERTTVAVDTMLSALLAIKLGHEPETPEAWRAVREWLQERLPAKVGNTGGRLKRASAGARALMVEAIADNRLSTAYDDWQIKRANLRA